MGKLFKPVSDNQRRDIIMSIRMTGEEKQKIIEQARIRNLTASNYLLRCGLKRRADVKIETDMILEVRAAVAEIKALHATYIASGNAPPMDLLAPVIQNAILAIQSLARY